MNQYELISLIFFNGLLITVLNHYELIRLIGFTGFFGEF